MKGIKRIVFFLVLFIAMLVVPYSNDLAAGSLVKLSEGSQLSGKSYLVFVFYLGRMTFDYYDFAEDGSFVIWSLEEYGEGEYSVRDEILFRAQFHGIISENMEFAYQIKGLIFSGRLLFGDGVEYLGSGEGERYYFLGVYSGAVTSLDFID